MKKILLLLSFLIVYSCSSDDSASNDTTPTSSSNTAPSSGESNETDPNLIEGMTGEFNLFPLAENPKFTAISEVEIDDSELVGILTFQDSIRVYPYSFLTHNEVVNDEFQGEKFVFSYCPITKSSLAFKRNGIWRASGYLYRDNLTPWDKDTGTVWSQMLIKGLVGSQANSSLNTIPVVETTWKTVKEYFPDAKTVTGDLFSTRPSSPPEDEKDNTDSEFSPELNDYVYGIIGNNKVFIFKYSDFSETNVIEKTIDSEKYIVYGDSEKRIVNAFKVSSFNTYDVIKNQFPLILEGPNGIKYDIFGRGDDGSTLEKPKYAYVAIWRAWINFYTSYDFKEE